MQIIQTLSEWQLLRNHFGSNNTLGFVPTMGNLHQGHESLLTRAKKENQQTVLSIFINPTQFDDVKDFGNYPKTLQADKRVAESCGVDFLLLPQTEEIYPDDYHYRVSENALSQQLCGKHRPGHFEGMLTVVLKLLLLIKPTRAYFGKKDFQQLKLVQGLVHAFFLDTEIVSCETVRDENGLALSSRNARLTPEEYQLALEFPKLLGTSLPVAELKSQLTKLGFSVDYIEEHEGRRFGAVRIGQVRLIDNIKNYP